MKNKKRILSVSLSVVVSVFLVSLAVYAATTIGANIETAGTLDVDGLATFDHATTTSATTTAYLYVGPDGTEDYFNFTGGDLYVADDAEIDGAFYVTGASTFTGLATFDHATTTSATTTAYLYVGPDGTENYFDFTGGDLYVADDVEIGDDLFVTGTASTTNAIVSGSATTTGKMVIGYNNQNANSTTTVTFGSYDGDNPTGVCFKIRQGDDWVYCYTSAGAFTCSGTSCE